MPYGYGYNNGVQRIGQYARAASSVFGAARAGYGLYRAYQAPGPGGKRRAGYRAVAYGGTKRRAYARPGFTRMSGYYGRYGQPRGLAIEKKFFDITLTESSVASDGSNLTDSLIEIAQGTTEKTRIGRKCTITNIGFRYENIMKGHESQAAALPGESVRMIIFLDKQANGATAAVLDILETANWLSFNNLANSNRFKTLLDRTIDLNPTNLTSEGSNVVTQSAIHHNGSWYMKCSIPIEYSGTAGAITEIKSNNIGFLIIASGAGNTSFGAKFRFRFTDL